MARRRPPTDEQKTAIYDSQQRGRAAKPTKQGFESGQVEVATPTLVDKPRRDRSAPIRVISMKTPAAAARAKKLTAKQHKPEIRSLADVVKKNATPAHGMGYLAPPANPKERRGRKLRDWLIWGSVLVMITCAVMLAVWFLAGR